MYDLRPIKKNDKRKKCLVQELEFYARQQNYGEY